MRILLTGFEPFGGEAVNPSAEAVWRVARGGVDGVEIHPVILPVEFTAAPERLAAAIADIRPGAVVMLGEAGGRAAISVERVAINWADARMPDNAGARPLETELVPGAPAAYFGTLPVSDIVADIRRGGIPAEVSLSAGAYVCNATYYAACHLRAETSARFVAGFIHVPYAPEQVVAKHGTASMALETTAEAIRIALGVIAGQARA